MVGQGGQAEQGLLVQFTAERITGPAIDPVGDTDAVFERIPKTGFGSSGFLHFALDVERHAPGIVGNARRPAAIPGTTVATRIPRYCDAGRSVPISGRTVPGSIAIDCVSIRQLD